MRSSKGFTLAELLVVMAIIAILAAILFPVLRQAQDAAQMRTCSSNLRELGRSFAMYMDDYNGFSIPGPVTADHCLNPAPLMSYLRERPVEPGENKPRRLWICPGDVGLGNELPKWKSTGMSSYFYPYSAFLANRAKWHVDVLQGYTPENTPRRPDQWARPSRNILLADWSPNFHRGRKVTSAPSGSGYDVKCVNFLMIDGHVVVGTTWDRSRGYQEYTVLWDNPYYKFYNPAMVIRP